MGNSYDGVVVSDGTHVLRIGKHDYDKNGQIVTDSSIYSNEVRFGLYDLDITSYDITSYHKNHPEEAILDFDGYNNTLKLHQTSVDQLQDRFHIVGCPLADLALSMNGYIPATGEWYMIFNHLDEINAKLQQIGGDIILKKYFRYSSTTTDDNYSMWVFYQSDPSDMRQQYGLDYFSRENKTFYRPVYQVPRD